MKNNRNKFACIAKSSYAIDKRKRLVDWKKTAQADTRHCY